ncbi:hypothetical protein [Caulobacter vibrioides]|nr:hypothetical protein [Caulobacter vibrioides]QXZ50179.1 hypothetical protein KZH45_09610 [Caulobacter vibrioides]
MRDRTPALLADAAERGALAIHDQPYMRPGHDRRLYRDGRYIGVEPLH